MLVEDYRKHFTAKGFRKEDIQDFARFYPEKGIGHCSIVIPSIDSSGLLHVTFLCVIALSIGSRYQSCSVLGRYIEVE